MEDQLLNYLRCSTCGGNARDNNHSCQAHLVATYGWPKPGGPHFEAMASCEICGAEVAESNLLRHESWHQSIFERLWNLEIETHR